VHKLSGDAVALDPAVHLTAGPPLKLSSPPAKRRTATLHAITFRNSIFANQGLAKAGKPRIARKDCAKITTRRKSPEWSALENLSRRYRVRRLLEIRFLELAKGFEPPTL
jgi:hypothetical protein